MIKFSLKKAFFDTWDNLMILVIVNTLFLLFFVGLFFLSTVIPLEGFRMYFFFYFVIVLVCLFLGALCGMASEIVHYKKTGIKSFFWNFATHWKSSLVYAAIIILLEKLVFLVIPYYFTSGSLIYIFLGTIIAWGGFAVLLSSLYFLPVACQLKKGIRESLKISLTLFLDNTFFTLFLGFWLLIVLAISTVTVFILPGVLGVFIAVNTAVKLRLYKYDYKEQHKDAAEIPWEELLKDDARRVGKRTLRGMIFPWKE